MTRRETIISAALINAGLLVILFVCALGIDESIETNATQASFVPSVQTIPETQPTQSSSEGAVQEIALIPASIESEKREVVVQKGDRLDAIAKQYGVTVESLVEVNKLNTTQLVIGQRLTIPAQNIANETSNKSEDLKSLNQQVQTVNSVSSSSTTTSSPAPTSTRQKTSTSNSSKSAPMASNTRSSANSPSDAPQYHYVQKGESPWIIAKKYGISVDKLLKLNHLDEATARRLREGDRLRVR